MKLCHTCKFFHPDREPAGGGFRFGLCIRIKHGNGNDNFLDVADRWYDPDGPDEFERELQRLALEEKAAVRDASGYRASLAVKPDFGCVLHEVKP